MPRGTALRGGSQAAAGPDLKDFYKSVLTAKPQDVAKVLHSARAFARH